MSGNLSDWLFVLLAVRGFGQAVDEGCCGCSAVHVAALMGPALIVSDEEFVEHGLHLLDGLEPGPASLNAEVLVEQRAVEALDDGRTVEAFENASDAIESDHPGKCSQAISEAREAAKAMGLYQ